MIDTAIIRQNNHCVTHFGRFFRCTEWTFLIPVLGTRLAIVADDLDLGFIFQNVFVIFVRHYSKRVDWLLESSRHTRRGFSLTHSITPYVTLGFSHCSVKTNPKFLK